MKSIKEMLARGCHIQWTGWMTYLFSMCVENPDGTVTIPKWAVDRWKRQMATPYEDLPEEEKESDRLEATVILRAITHHLVMTKTKQEELGNRSSPLK